MSVPTEEISTTGPKRRPTPPAKKVAPRKSAAPKKVEPDDIDDFLPSSFNLDDLERESSPAPFAFIHNKRQYVLTDPQEQDWQRLILVMQNPIQFLRLVLRPEDRDAFFENSMPAWKLRMLTEAYQKHFGMGDLGESAGLSV